MTKKNRRAQLKGYEVGPGEAYLDVRGCMVGCLTTDACTHPEEVFHGDQLLCLHTDTAGYVSTHACPNPACQLHYHAAFKSWDCSDSAIVLCV